jgi:hypothetical protein
MQLLKEEIILQNCLEERDKFINSISLSCELQMDAKKGIITFFLAEGLKTSVWARFI